MQSDCLPLDLEKAAGSQPPTLEVVQVVTERTRGLVGLLLWGFLHRALLISNPRHLWRQEMDSGPLRSENMLSLGKACRSLCWGPPAGHHQRYWSSPALLDLCTLPGLGYHRHSAAWLSCRYVAGTTNVKMAHDHYGKVLDSLAVTQQQAVKPGRAGRERAVVTGTMTTTKCSWKARRL